VILVESYAFCFLVLCGHFTPSHFGNVSHCLDLQQLRKNA
jgi:hypothetical protein